MALKTRRLTIASALVILAIAAIWYAWEISTFTSLPESDAKWWLRWSEWLLLVSAILLTAGLFGEWPDSESWKKGLLYKAAKAAVILGVVGELLGDGGIFVASDRVESLDSAKIIALETKLAPRSLSDAAIAKAVPELEKFPNQQFTLASYGGEPAQLMARIRAMLEKGRWKWFDPTMQILLLPGTVGIQVWAYTDSARVAAQSFIASLKANDIDATLLPEQAQHPPPDSNPPTGIEILVGSKY